MSDERQQGKVESKLEETMNSNPFKDILFERNNNFRPLPRKQLVQSITDNMENRLWLEMIT